jgi:DNA polymerase-3 subunit delta'
MSFKDILGQEKPIQILKDYLSQSTLGAGYLFMGPEGVGKKLTARELAKAANCLEGGLDACGKCVSCSKIDHNDHPDVHIIETGDDEIKIEDIRQLQKDISFRAFEGKVKVYIIDNAHKLNPDSANCLLKILEEPPKGSLIILVSDKPALLFKTIISRCKKVKFFPIPRAQLKEVLHRDYGIDAKESHYLAYLAEGRLGAALRLKGTDAISYKNDVIDKFALSGPKGIDQLTGQKREDLKRCLNILATWFRDMYLVKTGSSHQELINYDRKDELLRSMTRFTFAELDEILSSISDSILYVDQNINTKLVLQAIGAQLWKG